VRSPTPRGGLDDRQVQRIPTREIEMSRDHHELAGNGVERVSRVPEVFQMAEELTSFVWEGTLMLACQRDRAGEQFFKHGRTPLLGNPPILRLLLMWLWQANCPPRITDRHHRRHITATTTQIIVVPTSRCPSSSCTVRMS
jgi:hypothetical protein